MTKDVQTGLIRVFFVHRNNGQVAQSVEQRTENPRVGSSILSLATIHLIFIKTRFAAFRYLIPQVLHLGFSESTIIRRANSEFIQHGWLYTTWALFLLDT